MCAAYCLKAFYHEGHEGHEVEFDKLSNQVIGCAIEVHKTLGPGLLESAYEQCLVRELSLTGIPITGQEPLPIEYKGVKLDCGYRLDLLVDKKLIVELKSVEKLLPIHEAQLLTYMKLSGLPTGLLLNFNEIFLKDGIRRFVL